MQVSLYIRQVCAEYLRQVTLPGSIALPRLIARMPFPINVLTLVLTILGYGMFTILLSKSGDEVIPLLAFILLLSLHLVLIFERTFDSSLTVWAAKELAHTSNELFRLH